MTYFAFPSGGASTGASLHLRLPLRRRQPRRRVHRLHLRLRLPGLRPAHAGRRPDGDLHQGLHRNALVRLGRRLRRRRPWRRVPRLPALHQSAPTARAPTAARASRLLHPSAPRRATGLPTPIAKSRRRRPRLGVPPGPGSNSVNKVCVQSLMRPVEN